MTFSSSSTEATEDEHSIWLPFLYFLNSYVQRLRFMQNVIYGLEDAQLNPKLSFWFS